MNAVSQQFPSLDRSWADAAMHELIARGASSAAIGDALATADAHCADSGESAGEAFGDPRAYAASVPLSGDRLAHEQLGDYLAAARPSIVGLVGMMLAFRVLDSQLGGTLVPVTWGDVLGVVGILAFSIAIARYVAVIFRHKVAGFLVAWVCALGLIMLPILLTTPLFTLRVWVAASLAAAALLGSAIWATAIDDEPDPVLDPRPGAEPPSPPRAFLVLTRWLFVVATAVGCGLIWVIHSVAG